MYIHELQGPVVEVQPSFGGYVSLSKHTTLAHATILAGVVQQVERTYGQKQQRFKTDGFTKGNLHHHTCG